MSFGKMNTFIDIISTLPVKDSDGFSTKGDTILASVKAYKEERHGSEKWASRAAFSEATALFRFRRIPDLPMTTSFFIVCDTGRYNIVSIEDVKSRGMYVEILCKKGVASDG